MIFLCLEARSVDRLALAAGRWPTRRVRQAHYETEGLTRYTVDPLADGVNLLAKASDRSGDE